MAIPSLFTLESQSMKIVIGSDHHGVTTRVKAAEWLRQSGNEVIEVGPHLENPESVDYPDVASTVAQSVSVGQADRGVLICGTGVGMCITANKFRGVRAALVSDEQTAELSRRHNNLNILCLSGDMFSEDLIHRIIEIWLKTDFEGGRHTRRLDKLTQIEKQLGMG